MSKEKSGNGRNRGKNSDRRTFLIALLTAVIVVALYHFGLVFCRMFCLPGDPEEATPRYMLVPILEDGAKHFPEACARRHCPERKNRISRPEPAIPPTE